ncbi:hypothetical protein Acr_24g0002140 [Actinidia rufa]|uniref:Uncharacterized protein n=1 Tax=Actinidia rufa TaxID=165716 RepID=A0A7J0GU01_9ERIC|nr:hypothetical protein Acr_24g0002140 [Actinidia rufa]
MVGVCGHRRLAAVVGWSQGDGDGGGVVAVEARVFGWCIGLTRLIDGCGDGRRSIDDHKLMLGG